MIMEQQNIDNSEVSFEKIETRGKLVSIYLQLKNLKSCNTYNK